MRPYLFTLLLLLVTGTTALAEPVSAKGPWGIAVGGFANFSTAAASPLTAGNTLVVDRAVGVNTTTVANRTIRIIQGGSIDVAGGQTLTMPLPDAGPYRIFTGAGAVRFSVSGTVYPQWWGATASGADESASVQAALNSLPATGGLVTIANGIKFNIKRLVFPIRSNMEYRADDELSRPSPTSALGAGERIYFSANSSFPTNPSGGAVNEWRHSASFHPGIVLDVRKDIAGHDASINPSNQSRIEPDRASYLIQDDQTDAFLLQYRNYGLTYSPLSGTSLNTYRRVSVLQGIGTAAWHTVPGANTRIVGSTSGAAGYVLSVDASGTTVLWIAGKFLVGETVSDNDETTSATVSAVAFTSTAMPPLSQDLLKGYWAIGMPAGAANEAFAVAGKIAVQKTRPMNQYLDKTVANPGFVVVDSFENSPVSGYEIAYDTKPAPASRRLTLRKYGDTADQGHIGAVRAYTNFNNSARKATSSYNITGIARNGTGDYTVTFSTPFARADYTVSFAVGNPGDYAYVYAAATDNVRVKVVGTGGTTPKDLAGVLHLTCVGGDI